MQYLLNTLENHVADRAWELGKFLTARTHVFSPEIDRSRDVAVSRAGDRPSVTVVDAFATPPPAAMPRKHPNVTDVI